MTEASIEIRRAREDEIGAVQRLARAIWNAHYPGIITVEQIDYMLARGYALDALRDFVHRPDGGLELATVDGEPAAFAAWYVTEDPAEAKLDKLYVLQAWQRLGLGGGLVRRVADLARATGATRLILNVNKRNANAIGAYQRYGFAIREAVVVDIGGGHAMDDFIMAIDL